MSLKLMGSRDVPDSEEIKGELSSFSGTRLEALPVKTQATCWCHPTPTSREKKTLEDVIWLKFLHPGEQGSWAEPRPGTRETSS